jgi:hypothetical protein
MTAFERKIEDALSGVDEGRRATLRRLITGTVFVAPIVASFAMDGLAISKAEAQASNQTQGPDGPPAQPPAPPPSTPSRPRY